MFPYFEVTRNIPNDVLLGLMNGTYQLYGGVIRWAAGTPNAGQIVRHLIPVDPSITPGIMPGILTNTQQILQLATGTALLSGLGLLVSSVGFLAINNKLIAIDGKLNEIQKTVEEIKNFLESDERARLFAALKDLLKINLSTDSKNHHTILHNSRDKLVVINTRYGELLSKASTLETAIATEEYFTLTAIAQVQCTAELGMLDIAYKEMEEINTLWQFQARRIAKEVLLGEHPYRFLASDFVNDVSVLELAEWLDFAYEERKGISWIDELRGRINELWYSKGWFVPSGLGSARGQGIGLEKEQQILIPALKRLIHRCSVFDGYVSQYEFLNKQEMKPSEFQHRLASLPESSLVDGYLILEPIA